MTPKNASYTIALTYNPTLFRGDQITMRNLDNGNEGKAFIEFRRKVQAAEVLSAAIEHLLRSLNFSGKVSVVVQNGRVLKSGYEEGFFRHRESASMLGCDTSVEP